MADENKLFLVVLVFVLRLPLFSHMKTVVLLLHMLMSLVFSLALGCICGYSYDLMKTSLSRYKLNRLFLYFKKENIHSFFIIIICT